MSKTGQLFRRSFWTMLVLLCGMRSIPGADLKILPGHVSKIVSGLSPVESLPATNQLQLAIGLPLHGGPALDVFLNQLYDPASPGFRKYLTPEEFTALFGPTAQEYEAVKSFAQSNGLTVTTAYNNRLLVDV